ncbi:DUF5130 family protein [Mycobacterium sp. ITM-2016-00316]|uniref:DUF5130 family protein n=1 Tax=Mycobacterium sp. ITM-2016-00316 TaxID=2099695 RepID=UPI00287FD13D|nr:DUF5130 family protein [Mycobacterium sp. ITM-2016-00316]WNG81158.1 DUF5130 family protein [Mycobacterium sp. ITM-2016-00316]
MTVFLIYHNGRSAAVQRMAAYLAQRGVDAWYAPRDIPPGSEWDHEIYTAIRTSEALVVLFDAAADLSKHVKREIDIADKADIPIRWLKLEAVAPEKLGYYLGSLQWIDWLDGGDNALNDLVRSLRRTPPPSAPRVSEEAVRKAIARKARARSVPPTLTVRPVLVSAGGPTARPSATRRAYVLNDKWERDPILWVCGARLEERSGSVTVGGGASGKWRATGASSDVPARHHQSRRLLGGFSERLSVRYPFHAKNLGTLSGVMNSVSRVVSARIAVHIGDLGADTAETARELLRLIPGGDNAVLLAVSPDQVSVELVYGCKLKRTWNRRCIPSSCYSGDHEFQQRTKISLAGCVAPYAPCGMVYSRPEGEPTIGMLDCRLQEGQLGRFTYECPPSIC